MAQQKRNIIHLEINGRHYYFGSLGALFSRFNKEDLNVAYGTLRNFKIEADKPYKNDKCTIRKGEIITSTSNDENDEQN